MRLNRQGQLVGFEFVVVKENDSNGGGLGKREIEILHEMAWGEEYGGMESATLLVKLWPQMRISICT